MKGKLIFGLGGALLLAAAVMSALTWTPPSAGDRAAIQASPDNPAGD